jgi:tRNA A37 threonylcarbamoyladenosine dehydratase
MGTGNKLDPTAFRVGDISQTSVCPLARIIRKECKKRGIKKLKVVWSEEDPIDCRLSPDDPAWAELPEGRNALPGSVCFVPGAAGNLSTEDVVHLCDGSGIKTGVDLLKVMELSRQLQELLGHKLESYVLRAGRSEDLIAAQKGR